MWALTHTDERDLAQHVYRSMLSGKNGEPRYLRPAEGCCEEVVAHERRYTGPMGELQLVLRAAVILTLRQDHYSHPRALNCCRVSGLATSYSMHDAWLEQTRSRSTDNSFSKVTRQPSPRLHQTCTYIRANQISRRPVSVTPLPSR